MPEAQSHEDFTSDELKALIEAPNITVDFGADLLDTNLQFVGDISDDLHGGVVSRDMDAQIHGTCDVNISKILTWGVDLVRLYMILSDGNTDVRWNVGVFCLTTPERQLGPDVETYRVQGFDRLMLLNRQIGANYSVTAGTTYRAAILQAFTDAGLTGVDIEGVAANNTLPATKSWPLVPNDETDPDQTDTPVTWLRVINDLLMAINFRGVWADNNGIFRCAPYVQPVDRPVEFTFNATDEHFSIVSEDKRRSTEDVWGIPNKWVFRWKNGGAGVEGNGLYTVTNQSDGPTSIDDRGLIWASVIDYDAASQAKLVELGDRRVAADKRVTQVINVSTGPFPGAGHGNVFQYIDQSLGTIKVVAKSWSFDLDGGDVSWEWERVI